MIPRASSFPRPAWLALPLALSVWLRLLPLRAAENRLDYRFEDYREDDGRIQVQTHGAGFGLELNRHVAVRGQLVYDAISGATPTGGPPAPGNPQVPTVNLEDIRRAGSLIADFQYGLEEEGRQGRFLTSPQVAYSEEGDYESVGVALNQTVNFNQRNTAVTLGVARNFDRVKGFFQRDWADKDTTDALLGVRQVVTPKTVVTLNLTLGWADGYLTDPYKGVNFSHAYPVSFYDPPTVDRNAPELRPDRRFRQVVFAGVQHFVDVARGAVDASYRFQHDDWGILAHTVEVACALTHG